MQQRKNTYSILISPGFLVGLGLLLLNDFLLKATFHNWFTGKLSDFAGLFIFPLFFTAFFPARKKWIYVVTAIGFVFWKSEFSQTFIALWNMQSYYHIDRVVDYTDLFALLVLPPSFLYAKQSQSREVKPLLVYVSCVVAVFAFAATSFHHEVSYTNEYHFDYSQTELLERMYGLQSKGEVDKNIFHPDPAQQVTIAFDDCMGRALLVVSEQGKGSKVSLMKLIWRCPLAPKKQEILQTFESEFIEKLRKPNIEKSPKISYVW